jgi:hypothetical protein
MQSMTTMTTTMMKNVALLFQSLSIVEQQSVAATKNSSMTSADEFPIPSGVGSDWLTMADTLVTRFLSQNEHVLNNDSAVNDAARALKADVKAASLQLDDLRVRHESIIVEARRLLATRVAPCAAFQRVQTLALGKRYEALLTNSKTILSKVLASDGDDDAMIALCDALLRSANLVALSEPIRTRAPRLVALLRERSDAAVEARRVLHTTACRNALRLLGWFASAGVKRRRLQCLAIVDSHECAGSFAIVDQADVCAMVVGRSTRCSSRFDNAFAFTLMAIGRPIATTSPSGSTLMCDIVAGASRVCGAFRWRCASIGLRRWCSSRSTRCARTLLELPVAGSGGTAASCRV